MLITDNEEYDLREFLDPIVAEWFFNKYQKATKAQMMGIPLIHEHKNVLISSPTGTGKTLSGFLVILNELFLLAKSNKLEDKIYCVYISPLKALANDIKRNLMTPLEEIYELAERKGVKLPKIRVGVRSGDTSQYERQQMNKKPPHIFITTPESLALSIFSPKFKEKFKGVDYLIVDEIHDLASSKRGELLSLIVEYLNYINKNLVRIGLSATAEPIEEIGKFLIGNETEKDVHIIEVESNKNLDLKVICPVSDLFNATQEQISERTYDIIEKLVKEHKTTLVFTNTRSGAERVSTKLIERGIMDLEAHHSSLSRESRFQVEQKLIAGLLRCAVSSTSLELGIDIGSIDLVIQVGSPKGISKGLQRVGRSGHSVFATAKGRIIPMDIDDLVESVVLVKQAKEKKLDKVSIPKNSLDVLSQFIVGISLEKKWDQNEVLNIIRGSYCYRDLKEKDYLNVLNYLSGGFEEGNVYSKIWWDKEEGTFGKKKSSRLIYFTNSGTIPEEADYEVFTLDNRHMGSLSEKFVEKLHRGDIFVLGARTYEFIRLRGNNVYVKDASGKKPTVPSWVGEMLPRTFDLSLEVAKFRNELKKKIEEGKAEEFLKNEYDADDNTIRSLLSYFNTQMQFGIPDNETLYIEGYIDKSNNYSAIFHFPFGRRVNDALSIIIGYTLGKEFNINSRIALTDDGFMLTFNRQIPLESIREIIYNMEIGDSLRKAVKNTELFKQRFRHCATRSFMVLRNYKGREVSVARQQLRSQRVLDILFSMEDFPIIEETFREIENIVMDLPNAKYILEKIKNREIKLEILEYSRYPSPFSYGIIYAGISDIVLMEDKSAVIRELQESLLQKMGLENKGELDLEILEELQMKKLKVKGREGIISFLEKAGFSDLKSEHSFSPLKYYENRAEYEEIIQELISEGRIEPVFTGKNTFALKENIPYLASVFSISYSGELKFDDGDNTSEIAEKNGLSVEDTIIMLRQLERAYRAYFLQEGKETLWFHRDVERVDKELALKKVIKFLLWQNGPLTDAEILDRIGERYQIGNVLKMLVENEEVRTGTFLPKRERQYILSEDLEAIRGISESDILRMRLSNATYRATDDYISDYLILINPFSAKTRDYKIPENLIYGHIGEKLIGYFSKEYIQEISYLNRNIPKFDRALQKESEIEEEDVKNYGNVFKKGNEYFVYSGKSKEPIRFLENFIKRFGPLNDWELTNIFGQNIKEVIPKLDVKVINSKYNSYYYVERIDHDTPVIIDREDPAYLVNKNLIDAELGEGFKYFLIEKGSLKLALDIEKSNGILEVFDIVGDYAFDAEKIIQVVQRISQLEGLDSIVFRKATFPLSERKMQDLSFMRVRTYISNSEIENLNLSEKEIIRYILRKHHLTKDSKYLDPVDAISDIFGYKSDNELMLKSPKFISLKKIFSSKMLVESFLIHGTQGYISKENLAVVSKLNEGLISNKGKLVLQKIESMEPCSKEDIIDRSPFTLNKTISIVGELFKRSQIYRDYKGKIYRSPSNISIEEALDKFTKYLGIFNSRIITELTGNNTNIQKLLPAYFNNGLKMGKFKMVMPLRDRDEIYFMWKYENILTDPIDEDIVLPPKHPTYIHLVSALGWKPGSKWLLLLNGDDPVFLKLKKSGQDIKINTRIREQTAARLRKALLRTGYKIDEKELDDVTTRWYEDMIPKRYK